MSQTIDTTALTNALDAAAPDSEHWLKGDAAFNEHIDQNPDDIEGAYYAALDAAAPDEARWIAGRDVLVLEGIELVPGSQGKFSAAKNKLVRVFKRNKHKSGAEDHSSAVDEGLASITKRFEKGGWRVIVGGLIGVALTCVIFPFYSYTVHINDVRPLQDSVVVIGLAMLVALVFFGCKAGNAINQRRIAKKEKSETSH